MRMPALKTRLILILAGVLCIAFFATSIANYMVSRTAIHEEIVTSSLPLTRDNIFSEIHGDLMRPVTIASIMANDAFLKGWAADGEADLDRITKYLRDIRDKYQFLSTFFVSAGTGNYYHFKGVHKTISPQDAHDVWFYRFVESGREYDLDVDTDEAAENRLTIFINFRVTGDDGTLIGVTGVGLEMNTVSAYLTSYQEKYGRHIFLTDAKGLIQLHSDTRMVEKASIRTMAGISALADRILSGTPEPMDFEFSRAGQRVLLTARYMPEIQWYLIVEQEEAGAFEAIRSSLLRSLAVGTAAILISIAVVVLTINRFQSRLEHMAITDELTGIANRRAFEEQFKQATYRYTRMGEPFSVILMDLDGFKAVNDRCGHLEGDRLLKAVVALLHDQIRQTDLLARWGGDEFIVLVSGATQTAQMVAGRIRESLEKAVLAPAEAPAADPRRAVTVSLGVSQYAPEDTLDTLTHRADTALYMAKSEGGNAVRTG